MRFMVLGMNLTGILLIYLAIPRFVVPLMRQALEIRPSNRRHPTGHHHLLVIGFSENDEALQEDLEDLEIFIEEGI